MTNSIKRSDIVKAARSFVGCPFIHQGRDHYGIDCIGLIWNVSKAVGHDFPMINAYSSSPSGQRVIEDAHKALIKPDRQGYDSLMPGDVMIVWGFQRNVPQHFAFVGELGGRKTMIHAWQRAGKVIEHNIIEFWRDHYMVTFCIPGTEKMEG